MRYLPASNLKLANTHVPPEGTAAECRPALTGQGAAGRLRIIRQRVQKRSQESLSRGKDYTYLHAPSYPWGNSPTKVRA